ncbi:transporter substrate-binding domain-containing protein [Rhizobium grahamii]|uniref:Amino acid ABC transporter substrate-binding protein n=1 Tax=Rhizobium grahamii TaxID=1120045 RepID=A0A370KHB8_9HYPH|nr:transporter substrate-binding domain-containing protein [Rhizobium grahamii]RDJ04524.1 amino acid ABC transporter substrate-binding protein [Rhizobium grahamii]
MIKRLGTAALAASFAVAAWTGAANAGEVLDRVLRTKTLTVAVGTDWGPVSHLDESNELAGYDVDVAKQIAASLGVEIKFVTPGWDLIAAGKWEGRWDVAMGQMTPTKERAERMDFPATYIWGPTSAVVHKDSKATKPSDLEGKVVGVSAGTTGEAYANHNFTPAWLNAEPITYQFKPAQVKTYGANTVALDDLRLGDGVRLDAVIGDTPIAHDAIKAGYPLKILEPALFNSPGDVAIERGDKELSDKIAAAVKQMENDGTLSKLSLKWYDVDYSKEQ